MSASAVRFLNVRTTAPPPALKPIKIQHRRHAVVPQDQPLLVALRRAFYWQQLLDDGVVGSGSEIAQREGLHHSTVNELSHLILLGSGKSPPM